MHEDVHIPLPLWRTVCIVTLLSGPKVRLLGADRQGSASSVSLQQQCRHCRKSQAKELQSEALTLAFSSQRCPRLEPRSWEKETGTGTTKTANRRGPGGAAVFWGQRPHGEPTGGTFQHVGFCCSPPSSSSILVGRPSGDWIPLCSQCHILAFPPWPPTSIFSSFLPTFISLLKPPFQILSLVEGGLPPPWSILKGPCDSWHPLHRSNPILA